MRRTRADIFSRRLSFRGDMELLQAARRAAGQSGAHEPASSVHAFIDGRDPDTTLQDIEEQVIRTRLEAMPDATLEEVAASLGISTRHLYKRRREYGLL